MRITFLSIRVVGVLICTKVQYSATIDINSDIINISLSSWAVGSGSSRYVISRCVVAKSGRF